MREYAGRRWSWCPGRGALWLCVLMSSVVVVPATQVRLMNLEEMSARAGRIFSGRCIETQVELDPVLGQPVTVAVFDVEQVLKGPDSARVTLRIVGSPPDYGAPANSSIPGATSFRKGEEVILFLYAESPVGLTSPVGLGQGKFTVHRDKLGRELAVNEFGNRNLLAGVSSPTFAGLEEAATAEGLAKATLLQATASALSEASSGSRTRTPLPRGLGR